MANTQQTQGTYFCRFLVSCCFVWTFYFWSYWPFACILQFSILYFCGEGFHVRFFFFYANPFVLKNKIRNKELGMGGWGGGGSGRSRGRGKLWSEYIAWRVFQLAKNEQGKQKTMPKAMHVDMNCLEGSRVWSQPPHNRRSEKFPVSLICFYYIRV